LQDKDIYMMSIEGEYELADGDRSKVTIMIKAEGEGKWRVQARVGNSINRLVTEEDGVFTSGPVMSTKMMPPPEMLEMEDEISKLLTELTKISREGKQPNSQSF
jgi:hypothetical protein